MDPIEKRLKHLQMMGYETQEFNGNIRVILRTKNGHVCTTQVRLEELYQDFIIENIVREINGLIMRDF